MSEEDINFLISIQDLEQPEFDNACLERENERLREENEFLKLNNPEMNLEHWRVVNENKRKIDNLRKHNKQLKDQLQQKENIIKEVREKLLCYGETFDSKIHQEMQKEFLEIMQGSDKECQ